MNIDTQLLVKAGIHPTQARAFADPLAAACGTFRINTTARVTAFLAQAIHESANFTRMEENLFYSSPERVARIFRGGFDLDGDKLVDPEEIEFAKGYVRNPQALANRAYANRLGNGNEQSGDGWRYRGRGIFQLTGKTNYTMAGIAIGLPYDRNPELVSEPIDACLTAANFWDSRGCNELADMGDMTGITRKVNGPGMVGLHERADIFINLLEALA